jgi:hypothetical protein
MSNPTISPGYGFVPCSHDDPKRSHVFIDCTKSWGVPCYVKCDECAKLPARKPVEIPEGWELVPEDGVLEPDDKAYFSVGGDWDFRPHYWPPGSRPSDRHRIDARVVAFIRRKPVQPTERIKREVWLNVYQHSEYYGYDSKDEADDCATQTRIACVRVQIDCEKGEGL